MLTRIMRHTMRTHTRHCCCTEKDMDKLGEYKSSGELWLKVVDLFETEDKVRRMRVPLEKASGAYIKAKDFGQALVVLEKQAKLFAQIEEANNVTKNILARIIVNLAHVRSL